MKFKTIKLRVGMLSPDDRRSINRMIDYLEERFEVHIYITTASYYTDLYNIIIRDELSQHYIRKHF